MAGSVGNIWRRSETSRVRQIDWLFLATVASGAITIIGSEARYGPRWVVETALSLLIVAYGLAAALFDGNRYAKRWDKLGDNCYYLGFLFTLGTLALALYRFSGQAGVIEELVRDFGIALWTTIVGMLLRIIIYQLESSPEMEPAEALRVLGNQALEVSDKLRLAGPALDNSNQEIIGAVRRAADGSVQTLKESADRIRQAGEDTSAALQQKLAGMESLNERVNNAASSLSDSIGEMGRRIAGIQVPPDLLAEKLAPMIRTIASGLTQVNNGTKRANDANERLVAVLASLDQTARGTSDAVQHLLDVGKELEPFVALVRRICDEMDQAATRLAKSSETIVSIAGRAGDTVNQLATRAAGDAEIVSRHRQALEGEMERMRAAITSAEEPFRTLAAMLRERMEDEAKVSANYRALLEKQLEQIEELHAKLQSNAVSLIDFIARGLSDGRPRS